MGTGLSLVGGSHLDTKQTGGYGEIGFPLLKATDSKSLELRNYLCFYGFGNYEGTEDAGTILAQYKFTFGGAGSFPILARSYGIVAAEAGTYLTENSVDFVWGIQVGGGAHIYLNKNYILVIEMGGGFRSVPETPESVSGYAFLRAGLGGIW